MNKWIKISLALFILGIIGAGLGYKFIYNKPHTNYEKADADFTMKVEELFQQYRSDKENAQTKYTGKVIEIIGMLSSVETADNLTIGVFALEEGMFGDEGIRCTMLENHKQELANYTNKDITIKGYCTGYNDTDIIFEKCSIIQ